MLLRVVLDTNVLVSALIATGKPRDLLAKGIAGEFTLVTSRPMLNELILVLRRTKFKTSEDEIHKVVSALIQSSELVPTKSEFKVVMKDPSDDIIVITAHDGQADIIVTGDKQLLALEKFKRIDIVTVKKMLEILQD
ncbi:MAG: putative toxin-antitoxin system toxin component, PIN family [Thaumarchaeota archaeon]|nr:putative toxin-antitoxin system toxin component, PIN family [Nitrososphaerota archaeon]